jgi:hypothetical protein
MGFSSGGPLKSPHGLTDSAANAFRAGVDDGHCGVDRNPYGQQGEDGDDANPRIEENHVAAVPSLAIAKAVFV